MIERVPCAECGALILPSTAEETGGLCMPCKGGYRKDIEEGRRRIEEEKKRRDSPGDRFWRSLVDRVHRTPEGYGGLTEAEQVYFAVCVLEGEVYNGGFEQYFFNSSADYYARAVDGLTEMGAVQSLSLLLEAKQVLFGSTPMPSTESDRFAVLLGIADDAAEAPEWAQWLDAVDRRFCEDPDQLTERLARFAEQHSLYEESEDC
jgi:hypothetical protein